MRTWKVGLSDANGMDRHYAIQNGSAQFEFVPEQHYGPIQIKRLRGAVSEGEIMRLLLVMFDNGIRREKDLILSISTLTRSAPFTNGSVFCDDAGNP